VLSAKLKFDISPSTFDSPIAALLFSLPLMELLMLNVSALLFFVPLPPHPPKTLRREVCALLMVAKSVLEAAAGSET